MNGAARTFYALAATALRWLSRGETWAAERLSNGAAWCERRAGPSGEGDPRAPQPP